MKHIFPEEQASPTFRIILYFGIFLHCSSDSFSLKDVAKDRTSLRKVGNIVSVSTV
jgi:hypothetical protein